MDDSANCAKRYFFHGYQCVLCSNDVERTTKKLPHQKAQKPVIPKNLKKIF
jgi:hypothetical protein